ncbi:hypothetical protein SteCoe_33518 [Stentor coeruleus]|uniref:Uncharacterized protein n=1 Tax=Stentor coeruleus TaxID=5963 RepID=A0A1R2AWJ8_9CILI|nr:hypothetical protein SteCoe_33518 [Stentor coeruleus]
MSKKETCLSKEKDGKEIFSGFGSEKDKKDKKNSQKEPIPHFKDDYDFIEFNQIISDEINYLGVSFSSLENDKQRILEDRKALDETNYDTEKNSIKDEEIIRDLCTGYVSQPYKLKLMSDIERPVYKDRVFSLVCKVVELNGNDAILEYPMLFNAFLYTTTSPITKIEFTKYKDKIFTGTTVVESSAIVNFRKLVIREVSSYQNDGLFNLVILPEDTRLVKPCIIRYVKVKSRKMKMWKLNKKLRTI